MSGQNFSADIIIVGAGAAGMMAAKTLSAKGLEVAVLEARDRIGGRIYTLPDFAGRSEEGGAEFIHGKLEVTLGLLKDAGVGKQKITGKFWNVTRGTWKQENEFFENYELVIQRLKSLQEDISIAAFLDKEFSEKKYEGLRSSLRSYVEGYYSGEPNRISAKSFLEECLSEDEEQYRPEGGYGNMVQYLKYCCIEAGVTIHLSVAVKEIKWARDEVQLTDESGKLYTAKKVIITVPLGVWIANEQEQGAIRYIPDLPHKTEAAKQMGFGSVLKILIRFKTMFWAEDRFKKLADKTLDNFHMALSDQFIPTWWTQFPDKTPLLTGWLSGPAAAMIEDDENIIFEKALEALQNIFGIAASELKECITGWKVINWTNDPYTRGSYSYATLHTNTARKILLEPAEDTLFFAGEALYDGPEMGTVEAALTSGLEVADQLIAQFFIS